MYSVLSAWGHVEERSARTLEGWSDARSKPQGGTHVGARAAIILSRSVYISMKKKVGHLRADYDGARLAIGQRRPSTAVVWINAMVDGARASTRKRSSVVEDTSGVENEALYLWDEF